MKIIDVSNEVWMWVHKKYWTSIILQKLYSFNIKNWFHLAVPDNDWFNRQKKKIITCNAKKETNDDDNNKW